MLRADDDPAAGSRRARGGEGGDQARRRRVLDVPVELLGQPEQLSQPVQRQLLELLQGGRRAPENPDLVQARDEQLGQDPGLGAGRREVGEVARALPVGDPRQQDLVQVAEHRGERLGLLGRRCRQGRPDRARLDLREHRVLADVLQVAGDPIEGGGAVLAERAHALPASISAQDRVFSTCCFVSHARRACPTPNSA